MKIKIEVETMEQTNAIMALVTAFGLDASIVASTPEKPAEKPVEKPVDRRYDNLPPTEDTVITVSRNGQKGVSFAYIGQKALKKALVDKCKLVYNKEARLYEFASKEAADKFFSRKVKGEIKSLTEKAVKVTAAEWQAGRDHFAAKSARKAAKRA